MTVEVEYSLPRKREASDWQLKMARQIQSNHGIPIEKIEREVNGTTFIVRVDHTLQNSAVENILSDIEDYLDAGSLHVETR